MWGKLQMTECLFEDNENKIQSGENSQEFYDVYLWVTQRFAFKIRKPNNLANHQLKPYQ